MVSPDDPKRWIHQCWLGFVTQSEDGVFAELLNRLRVGQHTQGDISILNTCLIKKPVTDPDYPLHLQHIFLTMTWCKNTTRMVFQLAPADKRIEIHAWDLVVGDVSKEIKEKVKQSIPADCTKTMGIDSTSANCSWTESRVVNQCRCGGWPRKWSIRNNCCYNIKEWCK